MITVPFQKLLGRVYKICITETGFEVHVTTAFHDLMMGMISRMRLNVYVRIDIKLLVQSGVKEAGEVVFRFDMPFITFPNHKRKKLDWEAINSIAWELVLLFMVIDLVVSENLKNKNYSLPYISNAVPHLWFALTYVHRGSESDYSGIEVVFTENVYARMRDRQQVSIRQAVELVDLWYDRLTIKTRRKFERSAYRRSQPFGHMSTLIYIRAGYGVPQIQVPGNCACLGANPDNFKLDLTLTPHNLDHSWQLLLMLVAVVKLGEWLDEMMRT